MAGNARLGVVGDMMANAHSEDRHRAVDLVDLLDKRRDRTLRYPLLRHDGAHVSGSARNSLVDLTRTICPALFPDTVLRLRGRAESDQAEATSNHDVCSEPFAYA